MVRAQMAHAVKQNTCKWPDLHVVKRNSRFRS